MGKETDSTPERGKLRGLNYDKEYVIPRFMVWVRSGYTVWPSGVSGMDNQPSDLVADFMMLLNELDIQMSEVKQQGT